MNIRQPRAIVLLALLLGALPLQAAKLNQTFANDFDTNSIYLWSADAGNMSFLEANPGKGMDGWSITTLTPAKLVMAGPTVDAGRGRFKVLLNYLDRSFRMEWAEVYFANAIPTVRGAGTLTYGKGGWSNDDSFSHMAEFQLSNVKSAATPLPSSAVMLLSALALGGLARYRRRA